MMAAIVHPCRDAAAHDVGSYTFSGGVLQIRCAGVGAATRLAGLLRGLAWSPVPSVARRPAMPAERVSTFG